MNVIAPLPCERKTKAILICLYIPPPPSALSRKRAIFVKRAWPLKGEISAAEYENKMKAEIAYAVREQEKLGLDVLVHGEAERNDMVEYFGEQL